MISFDPIKEEKKKLSVGKRRSMNPENISCQLLIKLNEVGEPNFNFESQKFDIFEFEKK